MMNKTPSAVLLPDSEQPSNEPRKPEFLSTRPKATFQWPPDCLWPFIDHEWDSET
jgi:hypothetical protein